MDETARAVQVSRSELTPVDFLHHCVAMHPERVAVVHGARRFTYADLAERVARMASALRARGLERHDRVAVLCPNIPALLEAHFAVPAAGCVLVALNTRLSAGEIAALLEHSGARLLLVDAELAHLAEGAPDGVEIVRVDDTGAPDDPYEAFLRTGDPAGVDSGFLDEEEPISINYTSGTTGQPKGVVYTHRGAYLNALGEVIEVGLGQGPVYLWTLPMFHCNGWCFTWAVTAVGGTHVCLRRVEPAHDLGALDRPWRDALQRRTGRADRDRQYAAGRAPGTAGHGVRGRGAAVADTARPHGRAEPRTRCTSTV